MNVWCCLKFRLNEQKNQIKVQICGGQSHFPLTECQIQYLLQIEMFLCVITVRVKAVVQKVSLASQAKKQQKIQNNLKLAECLVLPG